MLKKAPSEKQLNGLLFDKILAPYIKIYELVIYVLRLKLI